MPARTSPSTIAATLPATSTITEISVPQPVVAPVGVAAQGNIAIITSRDPSFVYLVDLSSMRWHQVTAVPADSGPFGVTAGQRSGEFWVSLFRGGYGKNQHWTGVLRISSGTAKIFRFTAPGENPALTGVTADGQYVYTTELRGNHIDRLDQRTGRFIRYRVLPANAGLFDVTLYQGNPWFTEANASALGEVRSSGSIRSVPLRPRIRPIAVCTWGTSLAVIGQVPSALWIMAEGQVVRTISLPVGSAPSACVSNGSALWLTDRGLNAILKIGLDYRVQIIPLPSANAEPERIARSGRLIIFTESRAGKIGILHP